MPELRRICGHAVITGHHDQAEQAGIVFDRRFCAMR
jgi:hypothetical protein